MNHLEIWEICFRLGLALVFGGLIGWEREVKHKPAGLKTHILVALGACTFALITLSFYDALSPKGSADPIRTIDGIIGGIGFMGAGAILQSKGSVKGITTAATIWMAGALGLAAGTGFYLIGGISMGIALIVLVGIGILEKKSPTLGEQEDQ
jgi:putative Mg2+ transporter-C (MgtC) family protein